MPFNYEKVFTFDKTEVTSLSPNQYGVYGIFKPETWIYVGKGDIRQRLLAHLNNDTPCILHQKATQFVLELTSNADDREKQLIRELDPSCNQRIG